MLNPGHATNSSGETTCFCIGYFHNAAWGLCQHRCVSLCVKKSQIHRSTSCRTLQVRKWCRYTNRLSPQKPFCCVFFQEEISELNHKPQTEGPETNNKVSVTFKFCSPVLWFWHLQLQHCSLGEFLLEMVKGCKDTKKGDCSDLHQNRTLSFGQIHFCVKFCVCTIQSRKEKICAHQGWTHFAPYSEQNSSEKLVLTCLILAAVNFHGWWIW